MAPLDADLLNGCLLGPPDPHSFFSTFAEASPDEARPTSRTGPTDRLSVHMVEIETGGRVSDGPGYRSHSKGKLSADHDLLHFVPTKEEKRTVFIANLLLNLCGVVLWAGMLTINAL
jgi:hypothetical protein